MKKAALSRGFTLIEILIVVAIIGILIVAIISTINPLSQIRKSNDTDRRNDLRQYQLALENYATVNSGLCPVNTSTVNAETLCASGAALASFMSACPSEKKAGNDPYRYQSGTGGVSWVLWAKLETKANTYWVSCSSGKTGSRTQAGFTVSNGSCPL